MIIERAKTSGFCFGVKNAVETAKKVIDSNKSDIIYMYGRLIHNRTVVDEMVKGGMRIAEDINEIEDGSTVVLRAHGVSPKIKESLLAKGCKIVDCTCPYVKKIHDIVRKACEGKKQIILIGDRNHPEIIGIDGECDDKARIFADPEEVEKAVFEQKDTVLAAQTTYSYKKYKEICEILKKKIANIEIFDTICITTEKRQTEARDISARSDVMIVIGSKKSSNTLKLYEICKLNCRKTYMVEELSDVDGITDDGKFGSYRIGVVAGASTPQRLIWEVINKMSEKGGLENQQEKDNLYFSEYVENISQLRRGATVKGAIIRYDSEYVYVDVHDKSEGRIPVHEFGVDDEFDLDEAVENHKEIDVYVRSIRNTDQGKEILLSKARVDFSKNKDLVEKAFQDKEPITVKITKAVKDGVIGTIGGIDIYIHRTQLEMSVVKDLQPYVGKEIEILVTQFDPDKRRLRISGSRRVLLNQERKEKADDLWNEIEIGKKYKGIVRSLTDFGAFVDIGGVDGLVHVSELSWERIGHPSEIVKVGDEIEVTIKDFDQEKKRISLGYKKSEDDPYKEVEETYPVGAVVKGKVVRMFPFGAFVELEPGVDALCHISQISNVRLVKPEDALEEGMEVVAKVLEVDSESRRVSISIRDVEPIDPKGAYEPEEYSAKEKATDKKESESSEEDQAKTDDVAKEKEEAQEQVEEEKTADEKEGESSQEDQEKTDDVAKEKEEAQEQVEEEKTADEKKNESSDEDAAKSDDSVEDTSKDDSEDIDKE